MNGETNPRTVRCCGSGILLSEYREEVLQYAVEHNMINLADVQEKIKMEKREKILKNTDFSGIPEFMAK